MVDYSKWDNLDLSDSEEEEETRGAPGVYRVEPGSQVTIPGRNVTINSTPSATTSASTAGPLVPSRTATNPLARLTRNGGETEKYFWCQDVDAATVAVKVPAGTRGKSVAVARRGDRDLRVLVDEEPVLEGQTYGPCAPVDKDDELEWELMDWPADPEHRRLICVTLHKKSMAVSVWWKSFLQGDPEIDSSALVDRSEGSRQKAEQFMDSLAQAQEEFKRRIRERKANPLVVDEQ